MGLFGTSGIRGDAEKFFTDQFCFDLGRTFAKFITLHKNDGGVAVGIDPRGSSPRISKAVMSGLSFESREIYDQGATCVPSINYILHTGGQYAGSVMISGSHIKDYLNGVKFFFNKEEILKSQEAEIENIYNSLKEKEFYRGFEVKTHSEDSAKTEYSEMLIKIADKDYPRWKVVVDAGDGAQSDIMPQVLDLLGLEVVELNTTIQGKFFARDTEVEEEFRELKERVLREKAALGIGYDSDGDRAVFVDERGKFIPGDFSASVIAKFADGYSVVTPISTSNVVDYIGKKVYRTKVGSPYVVEQMKLIGSHIGFEPNGGCISAEVMMSRDGGSTTIKLLNILKKSNLTLSGLIATLPKFYLSKTKFDYDWDLMDKIYESLKKKYKGVKIDDRDGVKIWLGDDEWLLFRSSLNAPEFRVFAESKIEEHSRKLFSEGVKLVKSIISNV